MNDSIDFNPGCADFLVTSTPKPSEGSRRKSNRRSWFEKPSGIKYSIAVENHDKNATKSRKSDAEMETLVLTHFTNPPKIGFGTCKAGDVKHRTLIVKNPHEYTQNVKIERYPHKKNFSVETKEFDVEGDSVFYLDISWNPENEGNFREMIQFSVDSSYRLQAFVFGTCQNPKQKKKMGGKGLLSRRVKKPLSVVYTQSLANIAKSYSPEKSGNTTDIVKKCMNEKENRPESSEDTLVSKDIKRKEKYHRRSNTYSASGQTDEKPETSEQSHQDINLFEGISLAESKENQMISVNDSSSTPQTSHASDESSEQHTIIERSQTKVISPDTFVQASTIERKTKEESVLSGNLIKTPLYVKDAHAKNYVSPNSFLKDLNDTIENVPVCLDQSHSNSPENVLNESVPHDIMLSQLEFVKSNLKWSASKNSESSSGLHTSVKELTSIGSIASNPFSVVPEGTSPRRTTYTVKRQRPPSKAISRAALKVAGCKSSGNNKSESSREISGIQKLGNRKPVKRRASGSMTPSSLRKSLAEGRCQNSVKNNDWKSTFMTEPTPEKMALGKNLHEIPNSICLTPEILQETKNPKSAWCEQGPQMLVLPTPERMLLETNRADKAPRTPLSHHYSDLVLPTPEKNLQKTGTSADLGRTTSKQTFSHASVSKVEFSPKHMPNTRSPLLNDITHVAASTTVSKENPTGSTSSQVVSSTITKEKPTVLMPSAERKPFTCLFTPSKDRDEGQSDSSCSESSFPCTPLPTSPNPDLSRRSTHVVENPRIVDGSLLERKRLFPPLDDEEQENKENIPVIQSQGPCGNDRDKLESAERMTKIYAGLEGKVVPEGYSLSQDLTEEDSSSEVKVNTTNVEKVKVDSFACFVPIEDPTVDHNEMEKTKTLAEVPNIRAARIKSSNLSEKSTKGLLSHKRKADEAGIQQQKSKAPVQRQNSKPKTAGIAKSKLILLKKSKTALPKHPMPFASKNIYYDERWMEKQERGFSQWLNFILTPSEDMGNNIKSKVDAAKLCSNKMGPQKLAPTKEALSFKEYSAGRKLNGLRRAACKLFQSAPVVTVVQKVEVEVESQRLMIRKDRKVHADLGLKQAILDLLMSFNPLWLRIGLETVFGEIIGVHSNSDVVGLSHFIVTRLLSNPDIAAQYAHPSVPHLYSEGFSEAIAQHLLKKFLLLIYFLDYAKCQHMIKHDPCLFCKDSEYKSCKVLMAEFSRQFLAGEGDINRHLGYLGYITRHTQTALDEFDYAVKNLSTDLKDGLRLTRILDLLEENIAIKRNLRVPAISRLQKIHNMDVAFAILKDIGIDMEKDAKKVTSRDIVDGHREKTLHLLWTVILKYQIGLLLNVDQLKDEISILERSLQVRNQLQALRNYEQGLQQNRRDSLYDDIYTNNELVSLLLKWCRVVCLFYGVKVENFTVSFSDGRALCFLVHHYHPNLLPASLIHTRTTMTYQEEMESLDCSLSDSPAPVSVSADQDVYNDLLKNERENFKVLYQKLTELGGVPLMIRAADMCNTIPDEKVVLTYTSYLCARLLNIRQETRAARTIQLAWRKHILHKSRGKIKLKIKAAIKIQRFVRNWLQSLHVKKQETSAIIIQKYARGFLARKRTMQLQKEKQMKAAKVVLNCLIAHSERQRFIRMRASAVMIQSAIRGFLVRKQLAKERTAARCIQNWYLSSKESRKMRKEFLITKQSAITIQKGIRNFILKRRSEKEKAVIVLQKYWRAFSTRRWYRKLHTSAIVIQRAVCTLKQRREFVRKRAAVRILQQGYRSYLKAKRCRCTFLQTRSSCVVIQNAWRRHMGIRDQAAVTVQCQWRQFVARRNYRDIKRATVTMQSAFRAVSARKQFLTKKAAVCTIQKRYREILEGRKLRKKFLEHKSAATIIQATYRAYQMRKQYLKTRSAVITLQTALRKQIARKTYTLKRLSAIKIQRKLRVTLKMRQDYNQYQALKQAALTIQSYFRGHKVRKAVRAVKQQEKAANLAAVTLQCYWRQFLALRKYRAIKKATVTLQTAFRAVSARKHFLEKKMAVCKIQRRYKEVLTGRKLRNQFLAQKSAATIIQAIYRAHRMRKQFLKTKFAVIILQTALRKQIARKTYTQKRISAVKIQRKLRATMKMRQDYNKYQSMKQAALTIQAYFRGHTVRRAVRAVKQQEKAAKMIQKTWRCHVMRRKYLVQKNSARTIQKAYRSWKKKEEKKLRNHAAVILQRRYRALKCMRLSRRYYLGMKSACCLIQQTWRKKVEMRHRAALTIQSYWRSYATQRKYKEIQRWVITLQAAVRRWRTRKNYLQRKKSALTIQRWYRAHQRGREQRNSFLVTKGAALTIQAAYRGHKERLQFQNMRHHITKIQAVFRGRKERREYVKKRRAAITIQNQIREILKARHQQRQFQMQKMAAIKIQAHCRAYLVQKQFKKVHSAVIKIQSATRTYLQRKQFQIFRENVCKIQRKWRATLSMREARREFLIMKGAAITVQACYRKHKTQREYQQLRVSTVKVQSMIRSHLVHKKFVKFKQSSLLIQRHWRSYMEMKKEHQNYLIHKGAALTIQACFRGFKVRKEYKMKMSGVIQLQSVIRRFLCQKKYTKLRSTVLTVQRLFRRKMLVKQMREEFLITKGAAITIQAHYKRHLQQRDYKYKKLAVVKLQACLRMKRQRKSFQTKRIAAIKIQKWFRNEVLRKKVREEYHKKRNSVIILQRALRVYFAHKRADAFKRSVICIQAQVRAFIAMQKFQKLKRSTILLQRHYRAKIQGRLTHQHYLSLRKAAITIQAWVRRKQVQNLMAAQQDCAQRIQCWYRGRKQQREYRALRQAAVVCQRAYRNRRLGQTDRNRYIVTIRSVRVIQAVYRGYKARCMFQRVKQAVVRIQSSCRGFLERVRIKKLHAAATVIQRRYRAHRYNAMVKLQQAARLAYLSRFAQTVRFHFSAIRIQRHYRKYVSLCRAEEQLQKILVLQNWLRGRICRMRFLKLKKSILTIQTAAVQWLKDQGEKKRLHAAVAIQAVWRGRQIRMKNKSKKLEAVRKRVVEAHRSATEDKKLGNRTESALDYLLKYKQLSQILEALVHLDVATRLSPACCERMVEVNAVGVIYTLISSCNRSQPHMEIIKLAVNILLNLAKYEKTLPYVFVEGELEILLDLMQIYREKGVIFNRTCTLVGILGIDNHRRMVMLSQPRVKERIQSLYNLSARKYQLQESQQMRQAKLNASKMFNSTLPIRGTPHKPRKIRPAWVLHRDSLHNIDNPMQAINFVMDNLHIRPK